MCSKAKVLGALLVIGQLCVRQKLMADYPDRFVTQLLGSDQIRAAMIAFPSIVRSLCSEGVVLRAAYGFGCRIHPALQYIDMEVGISWLDRFINESLEQKIVLPGNSDFYLSIPKGRVNLVFCHEGHVHSSGNDWRLERSIWIRSPFTELPLSNCPGVGLKNMNAEPGASPNGGPATAPDSSGVRDGLPSVS